MEIKEIIVQSVIGIMSIAMFTGCSRDVIEHQFHIETQTQIESVTDIIDSEESIQTFEEYLKQHGFEAKIGFLTIEPEDFLFDSKNPPPLDDVSIRDISPEKLNEWVANPDSRLCIYTECEPDGGLYEQLPIVMNHMNKFYVALQSLGDEWEKGEGFKDKTDMYLLSSMVEENGKYYLETILTTRYSKII
ncbi:MAG TPA: hypothetical protein H9771_10170 [Candidatus Faecalibacterium faecipullorum]|uniref:Lipoprotein n=1 Tax=Candidatus Faecalibacterium faecipullorum TaxID=2838578 RepID=A0A9D2MFR5_9FIRM|nr:hypothetical protein [Candidatus Faecalibacterium faecipullorum]